MKTGKDMPARNNKVLLNVIKEKGKRIFEKQLFW
jgi:hypothetical protein